MFYYDPNHLPHMILELSMYLVHRKMNTTHNSILWRVNYNSPKTDIWRIWKIPVWTKRIVVTVMRITVDNFPTVHAASVDDAGEVSHLEEENSSHSQHH